MHNNINLLHISENSENKYVIRLMKTVFTNEEILGGYVIEAESSTSRFKKLDLKRIKLVKLAYFLFIVYFSLYSFLKSKNIFRFTSCLFDIAY